jgi:phosphoribosylformylglycinamidine (FGAM) synthase-like amidotransferase family enzyme
MRAAVVQFPGSNADFDAFYTLSRVLGVPTKYVFHKDPELPPGTDLVVLPGGLLLRRLPPLRRHRALRPIMAAVRRHADRGGLSWASATGFRSSPRRGSSRRAHPQRAPALRVPRRDPPGRRPTGPSPKGPPRRDLRLPIAHAEGRYQADAATIGARARRPRGASATSRGPDGLPWNPNGSLHDIAGIYGGPRRNVLGLMPHPERASEPPRQRRRRAWSSTPPCARPRALKSR